MTRLKISSYYEKSRMQSSVPKLAITKSLVPRTWIPHLDGMLNLLMPALYLVGTGCVCPVSRSQMVAEQL